MLCDDIVAGGCPGSGMDVSAMLPRIAAAQKYVLGEEFAAVADALSEDYTGLVKAFEHCRLPHAETWVEVAQAQRPNFMAAPIHAADFQVRPLRVGFLLTATRPDLSAWKAHLFWSTPLGCSCAALAMRCDMRSPMHPPIVLPTPEQDLAARQALRVVDKNIKSHPGWEGAAPSVKQAMIRHVDPVPADYGMPLPIGIPPERFAEFYEIVYELARADWAGEPGFMLAMVGLMNARNAAAAEAARVKPGKFEFKWLKIARRRMTRPEGGGGRDHAPMRGHFVRGHFKTRATGVYFWHPHARGDFRLTREEHHATS